MATSRKTKQRGTRGKKGRKWIFPVIAIGIISGCLYLVLRIFGPNTAPFHDSKYFYVPTRSDYSSVLKGLTDQGIIANPKSFAWLAKKVDYRDHVHPGRYQILSAMSNYTILRLLRSGRQSPLKLIINKLRTKTDLVRLVSTNLEADSASVAELLGDQAYLRQYELDTDDVMCAVIPDTYDFYWNTSAGNMFKKLVKAYDKFWTPVRKQLAQAMGLEPHQVIILASIIEEETNRNSEKPLIASVYLNRLKLGMRLSADPTVKFALNDFSIKRIYNKYTQSASPYNTYQHSGLPPGPICTPSPVTVDAVLHASSTDYLYFCAKPDFSGYHVFAATLKEHLQNARSYQQALDQRNIK